jgi:hypothetical protein
MAANKQGKMVSFLSLVVCSMAVANVSPLAKLREFQSEM